MLLALWVALQNRGKGEGRPGGAPLWVLWAGGPYSILHCDGCAPASCFYVPPRPCPVFLWGMTGKASSVMVHGLWDFFGRAPDDWQAAAVGGRGCTLLCGRRRFRASTCRSLACSLSLCQQRGSKTVQCCQAQVVGKASYIYTFNCRPHNSGTELRLCDATSHWGTTRVHACEIRWERPLAQPVRKQGPISLPWQACIAWVPSFALSSDCGVWVVDRQDIDRFELDLRQLGAASGQPNNTDEHCTYTNRS